MKKTKMEDLTKSNRSGVIAFKTKDDDQIVDIMFADDDYDVILFTKDGYSIHFSLDEVLATNKYAVGVKGIKLKTGDEVVSACRANDYIITITNRGYAKKSLVSEFPKQKRYGVGVICHKLSLKTGDKIVAGLSSKDNEIIVTNKIQKTIKIDDKDIPTTSRVAAGNKIMDTAVDVINADIV